MLSYIVEETLADRGDRLKGYTIALAVFGRDHGFDDQADPVVRLDARRLRRDLDGYYAGAGSQDRLRLTIPKGGYVPHFEWVGRPSGNPPDPSPDMEDPAPDPAPPDAPAATPDESGAGQSGGRQGPLRRGLAAVAVIVVLLAVAAGTWLWVDAAGEGPAAGREPAIIVLPFEVLGPGDDDRYLAAGLTQDLTTDLMRFAAFRLYSLPASFGQDPNADPHRGRKPAAAGPRAQPERSRHHGATRLARGEWNEGIGHLRRAINRTVSPPGWYFHLVAVHACVEGTYPAMLAAAEQAKADGSGISYSLLAIAEAELDNPESARHALHEMAALAPRLDRNPAAVYRGHQLVESTVESLVAGLRKAGWTERDVSRM